MNYPKIEELIGQTFVSVVNTGEELVFTNESGDKYTFLHQQDCCESVYIEDITGDLKDLENSPILIADESSNQEEEEHGESVTWTFYKFATIKGYVDVRWCGTSNGYYSEGVDLIYEKGI